MILTAVGGLATSPPGTQGADAYRQAVSEAYNVVRDATPANATTAAARAVSVLTNGGVDEPEVIDDLTLSPPDLPDARARLRAILDALDHPIESSDPSGDQRILHSVLAMHRYDALHAPPSPLDRFLNWLINQALRLLAAIVSASALPTGVIVIAITLIAAAAVVALVLLTRRRGGRPGTVISGLKDMRSPTDFFAEADRLARAGAYAEAVRALCAAVAAVLGGERTWESSPLTVREIFGRADNPASLQPLLAPFEAAFYGHRSIDRQIYLRAARAADPYRSREQAA